MGASCADSTHSRWATGAPRPPPLSGLQRGGSAHNLDLGGGSIDNAGDGSGGWRFFLPVGGRADGPQPLGVESQEVV